MSRGSCLTVARHVCHGLRLMPFPADAGKGAWVRHSVRSFAHSRGGYFF